MLIALIMISLILMAAAPAGEKVDQRVNKLCIDQATGKNIPCPPSSSNRGIYKIKIPGQGEPTMEKVTYFYYLVGSTKLGKFLWNKDYKFYFYGKYGC